MEHNQEIASLEALCTELETLRRYLEAIHTTIADESKRASAKKFMALLFSSSQQNT